MKKSLLTLALILGLTACGGSNKDNVSNKNKGIYIQESQMKALQNSNFRQDPRNEETCGLFKSENSFFDYELSGMKINNSGDVTGIIGVRGQILDPGKEALIGKISSDNRFEFSDLVRSLSDVPIGMELEVEFDDFNDTMVLKRKGFEIPRELGNEVFPYFKKVDFNEFESLNDQLTYLCRK